MMPIKDEPADDNNIINRVYAKMSEGSSGKNNNIAKLSASSDVFNYFNNLNNTSGEIKDDVKLDGSDHRMCNNTADKTAATEGDNLIPNPDPPADCQTVESEVKFLREWLLVHLDLVQQLNDEIVNKDNAILVLQQENEMLKERLNCMQQGIPYQEHENFNNHLPNDCPSTEGLCYDSDNEEGAGADQELNDSTGSEDYPEVVNNLDCNTGSQTETTNKEVTTAAVVEDNGVEAPTVNSQDSVLKSQVKQENLGLEEVDAELVTPRTLPPEEISDDPVLKHNNSFVVNNFVNDALKNLRMSIRRKRLCSSSSAMSNNESVTTEDGHNQRKRKKRKHTIKDEKILTYGEQYVTQAGEDSPGIVASLDPPLDVPNHTSLEVPRWRVKVYTSCYTMEGTENLDDDVYAKRHARLENDEKRRKRWDVQRIREQRIVEKLKQREQKNAAASKGEGETLDSISSLWPGLEDIKYLEVCDNLPVSAFGAPLPRISPSEFNLPWLDSATAAEPSSSSSSSSTSKAKPNRRSNPRRKTPKR